MKILTLILLACSLSTGLSAENKKLKIFILAGQSNMQGHCTNSVIENPHCPEIEIVGFMPRPGSPGN